MWKTKERKIKERLNQSVFGATITIEINLSNLNKPIALNDLQNKWLSVHCVTKSFNIQVIKKLNNGISIVSPVNNGLADDFNFCLPMWFDDKTSSDKIELVENSSLGTVDILANGNPVGFFKMADLIEVITGSPSLDRSDALACYGGIELQPISEWIVSIDGDIEIPYSVTAYEYGIKFINSVTKIAITAIK
jgi:hypothetical protein